jgi:hypothetical protein
MRYTTGLYAADNIYNYIDNYREDLEKRNDNYYDLSSVASLKRRVEDDIKEFKEKFVQKYFTFTNREMADIFIQSIKKPIQDLRPHFTSVEKRDIEDYYDLKKVNENEILDYASRHKQLSFIISTTGGKIEQYYYLNKLGAEQFKLTKKITRYFYNYLCLDFLKQMREFIESYERAAMVDADSTEKAILKNSADPDNDKHERNFEKEKTKAIEILKIFEGEFRKRKIMTKDEYERLRQNTCFMIENDKLPNEIKKINKTPLPNGYIRFIFSLIHDEVFGTRELRKYFFEFLHKTFQQFNNIPFNVRKYMNSTTYKKFRDEPPLFYSDFPQYKK